MKKRVKLVHRIYKLCELCKDVAILVTPTTKYCTKCTSEIAEDFFDLDEDEIDWEPIDDNG